jgi:hypothetical protein
VGRIDGTSRNNGRPAGVADAFQVSEHSVEPILANRCRNLFSHDDIGPTGCNKSMELWPEVALVFRAFALARDGEGLTWATPGPERPVVGPSCEASSVGPSADPSEEMALGEASEVVGLNIDN